MDKAPFHQDLKDLLQDPITRSVMASDRVEMAELLALLEAARRRLIAGRAQPRCDAA